MKKAKRQRGGPQRIVYLGTELDAAVNAHLQDTGQQFATATRQLWAAEVGQPELAESVKMGRPSTLPQSMPAADKPGKRTTSRANAPPILAVNPQLKKPTKRKGT